MACNNEYLVLDCGIDEIPKTLSGYFGRFSTTVCNKKRKQFPINCYNNNETVETIQKMLVEKKTKKNK